MMTVWSMNPQNYRYSVLDYYRFIDLVNIELYISSDTDLCTDVFLYRIK